ncbi:MAG TPA: NAD(P)-dependent oxidoreductase, partial [Burkholderiales bacterium]|nr:NAD(P)-dependent oxidoreductase [Burkholderiales bacterium]
MKVAVLDDYQRVALELADWKSLKGAEVVVFDEPLKDPARQLAPFDVICLMRERTAFPRALVEKLPRLKFVSLTGARSPSLDAQALKERGIPVSNTRSAGGGLSTVELTWGLIISAARGLAKGERNMRAGLWHDGLAPGFSLSGKTLGLLGLGNIGARVAAIGQALGMQCVAWSQNLTQDKAGDIRAVTKEQLFADSDVVTIHLV